VNVTSSRKFILEERRIRWRGEVMPLGGVDLLVALVQTRTRERDLGEHNFGPAKRFVEQGEKTGA